MKIDDEDALEQAAAALEAARSPDAKKGDKPDKQVEKAARADAGGGRQAGEGRRSLARPLRVGAARARARREAIAAESGIPDLLLPMLRAQVRVVQEGDTFAAQVHDQDGSPRLAAGKPMTPRQLVASLKAESKFGGAFKASRASGSGATSSGQRPNTGEKSSFDKIKSGLAELK